MGRKRTFTEDAFRAAVSSARSIAAVLRLIDLKICGGNYQTVRTLVRELNLDTGHWTRDIARDRVCLWVAHCLSSCIMWMETAATTNSPI